MACGGGGESAETGTHWLNSEVSPAALVAVAVTKPPPPGDGLARGERSVPVGVGGHGQRCPGSVSPSPYPDGSQAGLRKNSTVSLMFAALLSDPLHA